MRYRNLIQGALYAINALTVSGVDSGSRTEGGLILGVHVSKVEPALASQLDLDPGVGLVVEYVDPGSPAEKHGLQKFDILTHFEDQILVSPNQLGSLIRENVAGQDQRIGFIRRGKTEVLIVQLSARKQGTAEPSEKRPAKQVSRKRVLSISVADSDGLVKIDLSHSSRWIFIRDHRDQKVYEGLLVTDDDLARVPEPFESSLELIRSIEQQIAAERPVKVPD